MAAVAGCSFAPSETAFSSKKELHQSHSRDNQQQSLSQNLQQRLFILRPPSLLRPWPPCHWPQPTSELHIRLRTQAALPAQQHLEPHAVIPNQQHPLIDFLETAGTAGPRVRLIASPWIDTSFALFEIPEVLLSDFSRSLKASCFSEGSLCDSQPGQYLEGCIVIQQLRSISKIVNTLRNLLVSLPYCNFLST